MGVDAYIVSTRGNDSEEVVIRTLVGRYVEKGTNHGRKVYQKVAEKTGPDFVEVFLYYWDSRDGPAFEGWWFGNKLGGTQVWSQCKDASLTPPAAGWKIPWDGNVRPTLVVASEALQRQAESQQKVRGLSEEVNAVVSSCAIVLEQARAAAGDYTNAKSLADAEKMLAPQLSALNETFKKVTNGQRGAAGDAAKAFTQFAAQLRTAQNGVNTESTRIRTTRTKVELHEKQKDLEERDSVIVAEMMPEATQKANQAEDMVEKSLITADMIAAAGDDMEEVRQAVDQTEAAAKSAQTAIGDARIFLNAKLAAARKLESEKYRAEASAELGRLQSQLQEAVVKLNPLKQVRQDFLARSASQKLAQEVLDKLSPAEVGVDRAEEATLLLTGETLSKEVLDQAEEAVSKATENVNTVVRLLDQKKKSVSGIARDELSKLDERAKSAQDRLAVLRTQHREAHERVASEVLIKEANTKLVAVQEAVSKVADAEAPFLMGVEELPLEETLTAVKACETAATSANTSVSIARMFISTKLVEVKRFSPGPGQEAQQRLQEFQKALELATNRLAELKAATAKRRRQSLTREAESQVASAEALCKKVAEAAEILGDDAKLTEHSSVDMRAAAECTNRAEVLASQALIAARKFITARQIEAKGKEASASVGADLNKFQSRLTAAQSDITKYKKISATVDQRLAVKRVIEDAHAKLKDAEDKVEKTGGLLSKLQVVEEGADVETKKESDAVTKSTEAAAMEANTALKAVVRFIDAQNRSQGAAKEEVGKLQPRLQEAQERLDEIMKSLRERTEQATIRSLLDDSEMRVKQAEDLVSRAVEAEAPFNKENGTSDLSLDEASAVMSTLENEAAAAHTEVGGTKTFLSVKRMAAKRLSEGAAKNTTDKLELLQQRLETASKKLGEVRKGMSERKQATMRREVIGRVDIAAEKVKAAEEVTQVLTAEKEITTASTDEMKAEYEKVGLAQSVARNAILEARAALKNREPLLAADAAAMEEFKQLREKLGPLQADLDRQTSLLRDQEHKFVAQRLTKEFTDIVETLEQKVKATEELSSSFVSVEKNFTSEIYLSHVVEMLKQSIKGSAKTAKELFNEIAVDGAMQEEKFASFLQALPQLDKDLVLNEEHFKSAFKCWDTKGEGKIVEDVFTEQFRRRFICTSLVSMTDSLVVKGGKTLRKIEVNELIEALDEPVKDGVLGLMRVRARAEKDDKEGYVTLSGNQGTVYLEPFSPHTACQKNIEKALADLFEDISNASRYIEQKYDELKMSRQGPLADTKNELLGMKPRVGKAQSTYGEIKKKVTEAVKKREDCLEAEKRRQREAAEQKVADEMISRGTDQVAKLQAEVDGILPVAAKVLASIHDLNESPVKAMEEVEANIVAILKRLEEAQENLKASLDDIKSASKGPVQDARSAIVKLKVQVGTCDSRLKKESANLKNAYKEASVQAEKALISILRTHALTKGATPESLCKDLGQADHVIPKEKFGEFLAALPEGKLKPLQLQLALEPYSAGITRLTLSGMLQEFRKCVKEIAITTALAVGKEGKTVRKLAIGEIVEVLEHAAADSMQRVKCRAMVDFKDGWVTVKGNQGTLFLEETSKPYLCCQMQAPLSTSFSSTSNELRKLRRGEVLELLEGPKKEPPVEISRIRGKAEKDGNTGWATWTPSTMVQTRVLKCKKEITLTTTFDINNGKSIRKLEVGETLQMSGESQEENTRKLVRVQARANRDGKEGWVTLKGNQGTSFAEESEDHYLVQGSVPLESRMASGSPEVRMLEEGELFELLEGPKTETKESVSRTRVRNLRDGDEGWFTHDSRVVQPWSPQYVCSESTVLGNALDATTCKELRILEVGETLEALNTPEETSAGVTRILAKSDKDGLVGFVTIADETGIFLEQAAQ